MAPQSVVSRVRHRDQQQLLLQGAPERPHLGRLLHAQARVGDRRRARLRVCAGTPRSRLEGHLPAAGGPRLRNGVGPMPSAERQRIGRSVVVG